MRAHGGFPGGPSGKEPTCHGRRCKRCRADPWVGKIPWRRAWQPTPVFLPVESHGQSSLAGYSPRGCKESDMTERLQSTHTRTHTHTRTGGVLAVFVWHPGGLGPGEGTLEGAQRGSGPWRVLRSHARRVCADKLVEWLEPVPRPPASGFLLWLPRGAWGPGLLARGGQGLLSQLSVLAGPPRSRGRGGQLRQAVSGPQDARPPCPDP